MKTFAPHTNSSSPSEFDAMSGSYFDRWSTELYGNVDQFQRTLHLVTAGIVRGDTLDLGCGSRVHYYTGAVERWVGVDVSQAMLDDLRFLGEPPHLPPEKILGNCFDAPVIPGSFDTVCAMFLLHHLARRSRTESRERVLTALRKAHSALRPGGCLVIAENAARSLELPYHLAYPLLYRLFRQIGAIELPYFWSLPQLLELGRTAGFVEPLVVQLPIFERIVNPMSGLALPPALTNAMQRMTLLVLTRP